MKFFVNQKNCNLNNLDCEKKFLHPCNNQSKATAI